MGSSVNTRSTVKSDQTCRNLSTNKSRDMPRPTVATLLCVMMSLTLVQAADPNAPPPASPDDGLTTESGFHFNNRLSRWLWNKRCNKQCADAADDSLCHRECMNPPADIPFIG